jgi:hypothetical protein
VIGTDHSATSVAYILLLFCISNTTASHQPLSLFRVTVTAGNFTYQGKLVFPHDSFRNLSGQQKLFKNVTFKGENNDT